MVGATEEIEEAKMWLLSMSTIVLAGGDAMHRETFYTRGGKKYYEMKLQEQSGNQSMSPLAFP